MRDWNRFAAVVLAFVVPLLSAACATRSGEAPPRGSSPGDPPLQGSAGPVTWEIVDVRERVSLDGQRTRWYYTIVFKETQGRTVQFQKEHVGKERFRSGSSREMLFEPRLEPNSELRISRAETERTRPGSAVLVFRQYEATDEANRPVTVDVRLSLSNGTGRRMANPEVTRSAPPARSIAASESSTLTGTWRGYQRDAEGFVVPLTVAVQRDGSFDAAADDPPRYRFKGALRVRDGRVVYSTGPDTGTLTLHEEGGKRVLEGAVTGRRRVRPTDASFDLDPTLGVLTRSSGPTYPVEYTIWLEPQP